MRESGANNVNITTVVIHIQEKDMHEMINIKNKKIISIYMYTEIF